MYQRVLYQPAETEDGICSGICPVCKVPWAAQPDNLCDCTAPQPGGEITATQLSARAANCRRSILASREGDRRAREARWAARVRRPSLST